jgi:ectoine hydroxylase-related dioxygenase (phytanoyl-CoA dioxygenase family)
MNKTFNEQGWILEKDVFSLDEVNQIVNMISIYVENHKHKFKIWDMNMTDSNKINSIHCLHLYDNTFIDFFNQNNKLINKVKELLNDDIEIMAIEAFLKPENDGKKVVAHQDNYLWCLEKGNALTAWIALDYIDESNGGLEYISESNLIGLLNHEPSYHLGTSQTISEKEYSKFENLPRVINSLKPGDIQFHHSLTIHSSSENISNKNRNAITVQFKAVSDKKDLVREKEYRDSLLKQQVMIKTNYTVDVMTKKKTSDEVYNLKEDPWDIEKSFIRNHEKTELVNFLVNYANKNLNCKKILDLGTGIGCLLNNLKINNPNINFIGSDVSKTSREKAINKYNFENYLILDLNNDNDLNQTIDINADLILLIDTTWFILDNLVNLRDLYKKHLKGKYMIHFVNIYENQAFGTEYFTNHEQILKFFNFKYIYNGIINTNNNSTISYFLCRIE